MALLLFQKDGITVTRIEALRLRGTDQEVIGATWEIGAAPDADDNYVRLDRTQMRALAEFFSDPNYAGDD